MNQTAYRIRPTGREHAKTLADIHKRCFAKGWSHLEFESFFDRSGVFSAIAYHPEQGAVGFVLCWIIEDQCDILSMGVLPDYRRDGLGMMLLEDAMENAKNLGAAHMMLEVNANNVAAQTLYTTHGFESFSTRKNYYTHADGTHADAICMRKPL